jgi:hypothetical protein
MFYLKENLDFNSCAFFHNISNSGDSKARIEIHHEPFTLYDIVAIVLNKYMETGMPINESYIAEEVMELHYRNMVGLIPLSKTVHQLYHSSIKNDTGKLFIPINMVYGNFKEFVKEYAEYIEDPIYERFTNRIEATKNLTEESFQSLQKEFEYLEIEGVDKVEKMEVEGEAIA